MCKTGFESSHLKLVCLYVIVNNGLKNHNGETQNGSNAVPLVQQNCLNYGSAPRNIQLKAWTKQEGTKTFKGYNTVLKALQHQGQLYLEC